MLRTASRIAQRTQRSLGQRAFATEASIPEHGPSFGLSEDQTAMQQLARDFAAKDIIPVAAEYDRNMKVSRTAKRSTGHLSWSRRESPLQPANEVVRWPTVSLGYCQGCTRCWTHELARSRGCELLLSGNLSQTHAELDLFNSTVELVSPCSTRLSSVKRLDMDVLESLPVSCRLARSMARS